MNKSNCDAAYRIGMQSNDVQIQSVVLIADSVDVKSNVSYALY